MMTMRAARSLRLLKKPSNILLKSSKLLKSFKLFSSGKGEIGPNQLLKVMQELGINVNKREAYALFGRFDINKDGGIVYYEFIDSLMAKGEAKRSEGYYDK